MSKVTRIGQLIPIIMLIAVIGTLMYVTWDYNMAILAAKWAASKVVFKWFVLPMIVIGIIIWIVHRFNSKK